MRSSANGRRNGGSRGWRGWRGLTVGLAAALALAACDTADRAADAPNNTTRDRGKVSAAAAPRATSSETAAAARAAGPPGAAAPAGATRPRVLVVGTSLTAGLGLDPSDAYPAVLQRKADSAGYAVQIVNAGLSGETSAGLARRLDWLLREPAAVVLIETGANDGLRGQDPDSLRANLGRIVGAVQARLPEAHVVLVQMEAPPNFGPAYTARFRAVYAQVARETGATLAPFLLADVAGIRALNQGDGIHPNEEGARRAAATLWPTLAPLLQSLDQVGATR